MGFNKIGGVEEKINQMNWRVFFREGFGGVLDRFNVGEWVKGDKGWGELVERWVNEMGEMEGRGYQRKCWGCFGVTQ